MWYVVHIHQVSRFELNSSRVELVGSFSFSPGDSWLKRGPHTSDVNSTCFSARVDSMLQLDPARALLSDATSMFWTYSWPRDTKIWVKNVDKMSSVTHFPHEWHKTESFSASSVQLELVNELELNWSSSFRVGSSQVDITSPHTSPLHLLTSYTLTVTTISSTRCHIFRFSKQERLSHTQHRVSSPIQSHTVPYSMQYFVSFVVVSSVFWSESVDINVCLSAVFVLCVERDGLLCLVRQHHRSQVCHGSYMRIPKPYPNHTQTIPIQNHRTPTSLSASHKPHSTPTQVKNHRSFNFSVKKIYQMYVLQM